MKWITAALVFICVSQIDIPRLDLDGAEPQVATRIKALAEAIELAPDDAGAWGAYAIALHAHSYDRQADLAYAEAQRLDPKEFKWPYFRAVLFEKSDVARSLELLDLAITLDPSYGPAHDRRGVILRGGLGREDEAEQAFRQAVRLLPESPSANLHLGQIELKKGRIDAAIRHFEIARKRWPDDIGVLSSLAQAYARQGDRARARELADAARRGRRMPPITDPRLNEVADAAVKLSSFLKRADEYNRAGLIAEAESELEKALRLGHDPGPVHDVMARVRLNLGKHEQCIESGQLALAAGRNNVVLHRAMGIALLQLRRLDEAERSVAAGLALEQANPELLQLSGQIAAARGQNEEAIKQWDRALEKENDPATRRLRAQALSRLGQHAEAISELKALSSNSSADWRTWLALGEAHRHADHLDDALAAFERAAKDATVPLAGRSAAVVLVQQRQFVEAERLLRALRSRWPRNPSVANDLAWLLATCPDEQVRDGATALALMEPVVGQKSRRIPTFLDTYAAALAENGQFGKATAVMDEVLALLPERDPLKQRAAYTARHRAYAGKRPWREE